MNSLLRVMVMCLKNGKKLRSQYVTVYSMDLILCMVDHV